MGEAEGLAYQGLEKEEEASQQVRGQGGQLACLPVYRGLFVAAAALTADNPLSCTAEQQASM